jgi:hypothetical protein
MTSPERSREHEVWREDLIGALAALTLVLGLFLDGWNHINLQNGALGGFFTPWHGLLYAGFTFAAIWVTTRNPHLYRRGGPEPSAYLYRFRGIPLRYPLAVAGIIIATGGLLGDIVWHSVFGTENGVARVIAPFHLLLFFGASLLIAAPLRSAWHAPEFYPSSPSYRQILPALLALTLVTAVIAFMFQWISPFVDWPPALRIDHVPEALRGYRRVAGTVEFADVSRVLIANIVLVAPVLMALRRWRLPFGSITTMWTIVAALMAALSEFRLSGTIAAAAVGGLVADILVQRLRPSSERPLAYRIIGGVTPVALWASYFAALAIFHHTRWPADLWLGVVGVAALNGLALSFLAVPLSVPTAAAHWAP